MEQMGMTAKVSAFARAFHAERDAGFVFCDPFAKPLLGADYDSIAANMRGGIAFFDKDYRGDEPLCRVVYGFLAAAPLARAAFCEDALRVKDAKNYWILGAGFDSFALRRPNWARDTRVVEFDLPEASEAKRAAVEALGGQAGDVSYVACDLARSGWSAGARGAADFVSLLGLCHYVSEADFIRLLGEIAENLAEGGQIALDCPDAHMNAAGSAKRMAMANASGEAMRAGYTPEGLETIARAAGLRVKVCLDADEARDRYLGAFNKAHPDRQIAAPENTYFVLLEK